MAVQPVLAAPEVTVVLAAWAALAELAVTVAMVVPVVMVAQAVQLVLAVQEAQEVPVLTVWLWHLVELVHQVIPEQLVIKVLPELKALPV